MTRHVPFLLIPMLLASHPAADWRGDLRDGLTAEAWFDDDRTRGFLRIGGYTSKLYRAWKVEVADLDGDGKRELVLGIWSNQRRHAEPDPHRAVWVLRWDDDKQQLIEAWRGSALARPLEDFSIVDDQLVASERVRDRCFRTTYKWNGFGFHGVESLPRPCETP